jgi:hypothetical protein
MRNPFGLINAAFVRRPATAGGGLDAVGGMSVPFSRSRLAEH